MKNSPGVHLVQPLGLGWAAAPTGESWLLRRHLPANVQQVTAQVLCPCHPRGELGWSPGLLAPAWPSPDCCGHSGNESK